MPEDLQDHHEHHHEAAEQLSVSAETEQNLQRIKEAGQEAEHDPLLRSLGALKERADHQAKRTQEYDMVDDEPSSAPTIVMHRQLKDDAYQRTLQKTRRHLSPTDRAFSRVVHQPAVETISSVAANTVGRPSGLLAGSFFALLGSGFLLIMTRRYGFSYNYAVFLLCFVGGFALGLLVELFWRLIHRRA